MYAIVDVETTGGYAEHHRITEIAILVHDGKKITQQYHTLINPNRAIPSFITGLTGITSHMLKDAPTFEEVAEQIHALLKDNVFVAHNVQFDYSFVKKELQLAGYTWKATKLDTVRLSRKIFPGFKSYGLGRLTEQLGIPIQNRHRALGDAEATAKIFHWLLEKDSAVIQQALKRNKHETHLPSQLDVENYRQLPNAPGVYYFWNNREEVIYVGKATDIKKRITAHFTGIANEWNRANIRYEIKKITYQLTGNELIALLLEAAEIQRLWPRYNIAQKQRSEEWGVFSYEDRNGYLRFTVHETAKGSRPLITFPTKGNTWDYMWTQVKAYSLCPKLSGLQIAKGLCYAYQTGTCQGGCMQIESCEVYNERAQQFILSTQENQATLVIVGNGRTHDEKSFVLVENGLYVGFGYADKQPENLKEIKAIITPMKENRICQNIVRSHLLAHPSNVHYFEQKQKQPTV